MKPLKLLLLTSALSLAAASGARALPVEVTVMGTVENATGSPPGGITAGALFSGVIAFDPTADVDPSTSGMEFPAANFTLQLELDGAVFEIAPAPGATRARYGIGWIDEDGVPADPEDAGAFLIIYLNAAGSARATATGQELFFTLSFSLPIPGETPSYLLGPPPLTQLPPTAHALADYLADGDQGQFADFLYLGDASELPPWGSTRVAAPCGGGASFCVETLVIQGTPVPEPSTATLLGLGLVAIGVSRRRGR